MPAVAAVALFASAAGYGFIWDDPLVLEQLRHVHGARDLLVPPDAIPKFYYRPLVFLSFLFDRALYGEAPFWFHVSVIAWHALVTALVALLALQLLGRAYWVEAGAAALLFAVHPVHVESVAWIAGRSDVIAGAFLIVSVLLSARTTQPWTAWASAGALFAALLAKEVALAGVVLIPARAWLFEGRLRWSRLWPMAVAVVAYLLMRRVGLGIVATGVPVNTPVGQMLRDLLASLGWYLSMLVAPVQLSAYVPEVPAASMYPVLGAIVVLAGVGMLAVAVRTKRPVPAFLLLWFGVTLAPSLLVIVRRSASAVLAERYLYLPSVAAVVLIAWGCARLSVSSPARWRLALGVVLIAVGLGTAQSVARLPVWGDDLTFWADVVAKTPHDAMSRRELASALLKRDRFDEATRELRAALSLPAPQDEMVKTYNNLGNVLLRRDDLDEAAKAFEAGAEIVPHPYLLNGLARVAMKRAEGAQARGDQAEVVRQVVAARRLLERAIAADAADYRSRVLLGQVLLSLGERDAARRELEEGLRLAPPGRIADTARSYLQRAGS